MRWKVAGCCKIAPAEVRFFFSILFVCSDSMHKDTPRYHFRFLTDVSGLKTPHMYFSDQRLQLRKLIDRFTPKNRKIALNIELILRPEGCILDKRTSC